MAKSQEVPAERCARCGEGPGAHRPQPGCPYNGWSNYETWCVGLWLDNEEGSQRHVRALVREARRESGPHAQCWCDHEREDHDTERCRVVGCGCTSPIFREAAGVLADALKGWVEDMAPELGASVFSDLLNAALGEVDWYELAGNYLSEE